MRLIWVIPLFLLLFSISPTQGDDPDLLIDVRILTLELVNTSVYKDHSEVHFFFSLSLEIFNPNQESIHLQYSSGVQPFYGVIDLLQGNKNLSVINQPSLSGSHDVVSFYEFPSGLSKTTSSATLRLNNTLQTTLPDGIYYCYVKLAPNSLSDGKTPVVIRNSYGATIYSSNGTITVHYDYVLDMNYGIITSSSPIFHVSYSLALFLVTLFGMVPLLNPRHVMRNP